MREISRVFRIPLLSRVRHAFPFMWRPRVLRDLLSSAEHAEICSHAFMTLRRVEFHPNVLSNRAPLVLLKVAFFVECPIYESPLVGRDEREG